MTQAGKEKCQHLKVRQEGEVITALVKHIAEVSNREGVVPIVVWWVPVASFHHKNKPYLYTSLNSLRMSFIQFISPCKGIWM